MKRDIRVLVQAQVDNQSDRHVIRAQEDLHLEALLEEVEME